MRPPLSSPRGLRPTPDSKHHREVGGVFWSLARASCKPHLGSPGAADPPRPSLCSPQPRAFVSHALTRSHTHPRSHARTHTVSLAHTRKGRAHSPHARTGVEAAEEGTDGPWTDRLPELGKRGGEAQEPAAQDGRGRAARTQRDAEETLGLRGQRMGRQGLARTRLLLQGWGLLQPLTLSVWREPELRRWILDRTRGAQGHHLPSCA